MFVCFPERVDVFSSTSLFSRALLRDGDVEVDADGAQLGVEGVVAHAPAVGVVDVRLELSLDLVRAHGGHLAVGEAAVPLGGARGEGDSL